MKILAQHISCIVHQPLDEDGPNEFQQAADAGYNEIYMAGPSGLFKYHRLRDGLDGLVRYVQIKVDKIPGLTIPTLNQEVQFLPAGKIPKTLLDQIVQFFKRVMTVKKDELEAMAMILWNKDRGYFIHIPDQRISKASVSYDRASIPPGSSIILDIHSHNTMNAFFSGTDNADDKVSITYSGVVGKINDPVPQMVFRFNYQDKKFDAKMEDIFEVPQLPEILIPDDWVEKVQTQTYAYRGKGGTTHGGGSIYPISTYPGNTRSYTPPQQQHPGQRQGNGVPIGNTHIPSDSFLMNASDEEIEEAFRMGKPGRAAPKKASGHATTASGECDQASLLALDDNQRDAALMTELEGAFHKEWADHIQRVNVSNGVMDDSAMDFSVVPEGMSGLVGNGITEIRRVYVGDANDEPVEPVIDGETTEVPSLYAYHVTQYGTEIADAYDSIGTEMSVLAGEDDLMLELIGDMAGLISENKRISVVSAILKVATEQNSDNAPHAMIAIKEIFEGLPDDCKGELFSDLHDDLPEEFKQRLATNGF